MTFYTRIGVDILDCNIDYNRELMDDLGCYCMTGCNLEHMTIKPIG